jgi:hypothetical protein
MRKEKRLRTRQRQKETGENGIMRNVIICSKIEDRRHHGGWEERDMCHAWMGEANETGILRKSFKEGVRLE